MNNPPIRLVKRLTASVITIIILSVCLTVTTAALASLTVLEVNDNIFQTGTIKIQIGDGSKTALVQGESIAPGMTITKTFTLQNLGTDDIYYKLYFENVEGGLAEHVQVKILNGDSILYEAPLAQMTEKNVQAADDKILTREIRELTIQFHLPEDVDSSAVGMELSFDLSARAVQSKNNDNKEF